MPEFIPLKDLRDRIWPLAVIKNLATDMTGVSLPILDNSGHNPAHPYRAVFMLYYAVPTPPNAGAPSGISRPYALITLDLQTGEMVKTEALPSEESANTIAGPGVSKQVFELPDADRRNLQDLFFSRCDEAAEMYASGKVTPAQAEHVADLLGLYAELAEPPLASDYETHGTAFFSWLRDRAKGASPGR